MYNHREAEGTKRRHQVDTVVEGMYVHKYQSRFLSDLFLRGINRMTNNIDLAIPIIDDAFRYVKSLIFDFRGSSCMQKG